MNARKIILHILFFVAVLSFEFLFCNSIFVKSILSNKIDFRLYVFSFARLFIYILFYVLLLISSKKIIENSMELKEAKKVKVIRRVIYISLLMITLLFLLYLGDKINIMTIGILIMFTIYLTLNYLFYGKNYKINIMLIALISIIYAFTTNTFHICDEVTHVPSAYNLAKGNIGFNKMYFDPSLQKIEILSDYSKNEKLFVHYNPKKVDFSKKETVYRLDPASKLLHYPAALGIIISEALNGTIMDTFYIGRIMNTITFLILLFILLKIIKYKRTCIIAIMTTPTVLMFSSTYSVDGLGNVIMSIFIAYVLNLYFDKSIKYINNKNIIHLFIIMLGISFYKSASYFLIFTLILIIRKKIPKSMMKKIIPLIIIILFVVYHNMFSTQDISSGDSRGGATNMSEQLKFLLSSPYIFFKVYYLHSINTFLDPTFYTRLFPQSFYGNSSTYFTIPYILYIIYMGLCDDKNKIKFADGIIVLITVLLLFYFTSTGLYLSFTPVGNTVILGYQSRYVFVMLILLMIIFKNNHIQVKQKNNKDLITYGIIFILNFALFLANISV